MNLTVTLLMRITGVRIHWDGAAKETIIFKRFYFPEVACNCIYSSIILISVAVVI